MISELADLLENFPGPANQTRCFTHVLNLVVKSVIRQSDLPKSKEDGVLDEASNELLSLSGNIEFEEAEVARRDGEDGAGGEDDNVEGWINECTIMNEAELEELDESVEPVHILLTKVS
ncbi:hypothetical protein BYT27DRAFT_7104036 [Phlegmacium glaucopus]|nr:hypothetical protein BYT27DRAFT_7104036 [Phlegmacium glaucopus]